MFGKTQILVLGLAMLGVTTGCYQDSVCSVDAVSIEEQDPEPTTRVPEDPAETETREAATTKDDPAAKVSITPPTSAPIAKPETKAEAPDVGRKIRVIFQTNLGHMEAELWPDQAPETVANFVRLAESGFYEDQPSHRMISGFIVQFGKPIKPVKRQLRQPIKGEFSKTLKHEGGTLSMATKEGQPDSATSQFFICFAPKTDAQRRGLASLDGKYAIFGKIIRGLGVLDQIEAIPTTTQPRGKDKVERTKPTRTILLSSVRILD